MPQEVWSPESLKRPDSDRSSSRESPGVSNDPVQRMSPRFQERDKAVNRINSSRALAKTPRVGTSSITHEQRVPMGKVVKHNLCFLCKSGGFVRTCDSCLIFTACFCHNEIHGCLPEWALNASTFVCPICCKLESVPVPYPLPSRMLPSSKTGLSTEPLVFYSVFLDEGRHSQVAGTLLGGQLDGYYRGKESHLLTLTFPYRHLGGKKENASISANHALITTFLKTFPQARFIMQLQTHASPDDGGLLYAENRSIGLAELLQHLIGKIDLQQCSNTLLLLNTCGGFIKHHPLALKESGLQCGLQTLMCLTGKNVEPLVTVKGLFYAFVDSHIIGNEAVEKALERCAESELLATTSVQVWTNGVTLTMEGAKLSVRPNGIDVVCPSCVPAPDVKAPLFYKQKADGSAVVFRCKNEGHKGVKCWPVPLIQGDARTKVVKGNCRFIIRSSEPIFV